MFRGVVLLLLLASMWAPSFLFIKIALRDFSPVSLAASRLTLAAILMWLFLRATGKRLPMDISLWKKLAVMSLLSNAFPFAMFSIGEQFADSASAAIINGTTPIFTTIFAHLLIREERFDARTLMSVGIGFAGVLVIFLPEVLTLSAERTNVWGMFAFLLASLSYGIGGVYARKNLRGLPPLVAPALQFIIASMILVPAAFLIEDPIALRPGILPAGAIFALAILGTVLAYLLYYRMLEHYSATFISMVTYILPPAGILLGVLFLNETPGWNEYAGCAFILTGIMAANGINWKRNRPTN